MIQDTDMIREDEADNRHFVLKLREGREKYKNDESFHDLYVSFAVHSIHEIDVQKQRFHALFTYYVAWMVCVKDVEFEIDDKETNMWTEPMFKKCFDPQVRLTNCFDWNGDEHEKWYRVGTIMDKNKDASNYKYIDVKKVKEMKKENSDTKICVIKATRAQGWFEEDFEMADFPLDVQHLHIGVMSRWDHNKVAISYDKFRPSTISSQALVSQTWQMSEPRLFSYRDDWDEFSQPLLTQKADSATGAQYCQAYFAITVSRRSRFVLWNVMFIMTIVGFFSFSTFALDPSNLGERQAVVLTLVLTTVAFKFVTMNMLPEIPYLTMIDCVIYGCMGIQASMMVVICISASMTQEDSRKSFDTNAFIVLVVFWISLLLWFITRFYFLYYSREKYVKLCNDMYGKVKPDEDRIENRMATPKVKTRFRSVKRKKNRNRTLFRGVVG